MYFLLGAAIGAGTGIPIGPVNVAVIDSAYRHHLRRAIAVGLGGAFADMIYAFLGIVAIGPYLVKHAEVKASLYLCSGIVLIVYGLLTARAQEVDPAHPTSDEIDKGYFWSGFGLGAALIFLNPGALVTWVVIVGSILGDTSQMQGSAAAAGVGAGSLIWFTFVAWLADHGKRILGSKAIWITRVVGLILAGYGLFSVARGIWIFATQVF